MSDVPDTVDIPLTENDPTEELAEMARLADGCTGYFDDIKLWTWSTRQELELVTEPEKPLPSGLLNRVARSDTLRFNRVYADERGRVAASVREVQP